MYYYIEDIIKRGYEPIVLETRLSDPEAEQFFNDYRKRCYSLFPREVTVLPAGETYADDLKAVKAYDPVLVLAGEEHGVEVATHLADDLGLPGNAYKNIDQYIRKSGMQRALVEHGVRGIRGKLTSSLEEAEFLHKLEDQFFRMLYHGVGEKQTPLKTDCLGLKEVMAMTRCEGTTLIISDQPQAKELNAVTSDQPQAKELNAVVVGIEELEGAMKGFDQVIVDFPSYGDKHEVEITVENIFTAMDKVKSGGRLIVPESFYQKLPYGRKMIEALMIIGGLTIELPTYDVHDVVEGRKAT